MNLFELAAVLILDHSAYDSGLSDAEKKAVSFGSSLKSGLSTAAKAGAVAIGAVTTATTAATKAIVDGASATAAYGDNIDKASQKLGISAEAYQEWDAVLQHSGANISSLQAGLKTLASKYDDAVAVIKETDVAIDDLDKQLDNGKITLEEYNKQYDEIYDAAYGNIEAFDKLGLSMNDLELTGGDTEKIFSLVVSKLQEMPESAERTAIASDLLGRSAMEMGALLNTSAEDTQKMRDRVHELGGVMSNEAVKAAAAFQDSLQDMQTAIDGTKRGLTAEFLPAFTTVMDGITAVMTGDDLGFETISDGIDKAIESLNKVAPKFLNIVVNVVNSLVKAVSENAPQLIDAVSDVALKLTDGAVEALPKLIKAVVDAIPKLIAKLSESLPKLVKAGLEIVKSIASGISENIQMVVSTIVDVVADVAKELTNPETLTGLLDAGLQIIVGLANGLLAAIPTLIEALPQIITNIVTFLVEAIPMIIETGVQLLTALVGALPDIITAIVEVLPQIIDGIIGALLDNIDLIIQAGVDLLTALVGALPDIITAIVEVLPQIIDGIINALLDNIDVIIQAGIDLLVSLVDDIPQIILQICEVLPELISGIAGGIIDNIDTIIEAGITLLVALVENIPQIVIEIGKKIPELVEGIANAIGDQIQTIMDVGKNLIMGLWEGIKSMGEWIGGKVSGFFGGIVDGIKNMLGIHSPSTVFAEMGENMALGIGKGFDDEFSSIRDGMNDQMDFTANADVNVNKSGAFKGGYGTNGEITSAEKQPLTVIVQLSSGVELGRALIDNINQAKRVDGLVY